LNLRDLHKAPPATWFTRRERQILQGICARRSNKQIAGDLGIQPGSVKNAVGVLLEKFRGGLADRDDLMFWASQNPEDVLRGYTRTLKLHRQPCTCGSPACTMLVQLDQLKPAA
jgi:DNA-binding CsgD family transcriptional regulator